MDAILDHVQYERILKYHPTERHKCWFRNYSLRPNVAINYFDSKEHKACCGAEEAVQCFKSYLDAHLSLHWIRAPLPTSNIKACLSEPYLEDPFFLALTCEEHEIYDQLNMLTLRFAARQIWEDYIRVIMLRRDITICTKMKLYTWLLDETTYPRFIGKVLVGQISYFATPQDVKDWPDFEWKVDMMMKSPYAQITLDDNSVHVNSIRLDLEEDKWVCLCTLCPRMYDTIKTILDDKSGKYKGLKKTLGITRPWVSSILRKLLYLLTKDVNIYYGALDGFQYNSEFTYDDYVKYKCHIKVDYYYLSTSLIHRYVDKYGCSDENTLNDVIKDYDSKLKPLDDHGIRRFVHVKYANKELRHAAPFLTSNMSLTLDNCLEHLNEGPIATTYIDKGLYRNSCFLKVAACDSDVLDYVKKGFMAKRIQRQWRRSVTSPDYSMCRMRLLVEFSELNTILLDF